MNCVAVTARVWCDPERGTRNDAVDQRWWAFLSRCGLRPIVLPNRSEAAGDIVCTLPVVGILLTGGNDLAMYGGEAEERDATELCLIELAIDRDIPLIGVCRGMQVLQAYFDVPLERVSGHVADRQIIAVEGDQRRVNSYHVWGARETRRPLLSWAEAADGVVKAIRHESARLLGVMWHPERLVPFADDDVTLFRRHFLGRLA